VAPEAEEVPVLEATQEPLARAYDLVMLDLDGVVYVGGDAVPGAAEAIEEAAETTTVAFVTNNASRSPSAVAAHLADLGVPCSSEDVVTSAQAASSLLARQLEPGSPVLVLGASGLVDAVRGAGLEPVLAGDGGDEDAAGALVTGFGPDVAWRDVMRCAVRVARGLPWVACNTDATFPTPLGVAPGHGALVRLIADFAGVEPDVAGKPARPLLEETVRRVGGRRPLMVGDRLDTDIEGADRLGVDSLLVLTGVTDLAALSSAPPRHRPTYLDLDLGGLLVPHPEVVRERARRRCGAWCAEVEEGRVRAVRDDRRGGDPDDPAVDAACWWRAVAATAWDHLDATGEVADVSRLEPPRPDPGAGIAS
jgi:glycerol 3-phosphatase-2